MNKNASLTFQLKDQNHYFDRALFILGAFAGPAWKYTSNLLLLLLLLILDVIET